LGFLVWPWWRVTGIFASGAAFKPVSKHLPTPLDESRHNP
jgi:hypothetical protein